MSEIEKSIEILENINELFLDHPDLKSDWIQNENYWRWSEKFKDFISYVDFFIVSLRRVEKEEANKLKDKINKHEEELDQLHKSRNNYQEKINELKKQNSIMENSEKELKEKYAMMNELLAFISILESENEKIISEKENLTDFKIHNKANKNLRDRFVKDYPEINEIRKKINSKLDSLEALFEKEEELIKDGLKNLQEKEEEIYERIK